MKNFIKQIRIINKILLILIFTLLISNRLNSQTSGPTAPDFKGFTPINNNNLVNEFDGSFNYSIPVLSLPSGTKEVFNMALTYKSGMSPNEDASWVGFGWNLNPGIIQRQLKGFPDEFKNVDVIFINAIMPSLTAFKTTSANIELLSRDEKKYTDDSPLAPGIVDPYHVTSKVSANFSIKQSFNNRTGSYINYNTGASGFGLGANYGADSRGNVNLGASVNLLQMCSYLDDSFKKLLQDSDNKNSFFTNYLLGNTKFNLSSTGSLNLGGVSSIYSGNTWGKGQYPLNINDYDYTHYEVALKGQLRYLMIGTELGATILSEGKEQLRYKNIQTRVVSGYLHTESSANNSNVILDYYNENESGLSPRNKYLPIPFQNSDNFNVSGFGIGGTFRFDKNQAQMFRPISNSRVDNSNVGSITAGYDFTSQSILLGADINSNLKSMKVQQWDESKDKPAKEIVEINGLQNKVYYDDNIARFSGDLTNSISNYDINNSTLINAFNPLSTQINVNPLNSHDLNVNNIGGYTKDVNHNKVIDRNSFIRTKLDSEGNIIGFEITNAEGHKYYYDLPIQNSNEGNLQYILNKIKKTETEDNIMFSEDGKILYLKGKVENTLPMIFKNKITNSNPNETTYVRNEINEGYNISNAGNNKYVTGKFTKKKYNSAFLLTKIEMNNYLEVNDNNQNPSVTKPSIEDIGDYVIFNYRPAYNNSNKLQWREPYKGLTYNKGQLSSAIDEVGSVMFGQKDLYYLESIETKTHVAVFVTNLSSFNKINNNVNSNNYNKEYIIKDNTFETVIGSITDPLTKFKFEEISNKLNGTGIKRKDCLPAIENEELALKKGITDNSIYENSKIQYLEKLLLFTKDLSKRNNNHGTDNKIYISELVNTVNFVYDQGYPIWKNMPNSKNNPDHNSSNTPNNINFGKLTLKGIYTENEYVSENKSNPHLFAYKFSEDNINNEIDNDISNLTQNIPDVNNKDKFYLNLLSSSSSTNFLEKIQTPDFNYWNIDKWNNYNDIWEYGSDRPRETFQLNNNHSIFNHHSSFDPSAWNLKKITNPSKSDILVFYEENEYSSVQNRHATVMFNKILQNNNDQKSFKISKSDVENTLKITLDNPEKLRIFWENELLNEQVYYKFYFNLLSNLSIDIHNLGKDYITGYNKLIKIEYVVLEKNFIFTFDNNLPFKKCKNFVKNLDGMIEKGYNNIILNDLDFTSYFYETFGRLDNKIPSILDGALKGNYDCQNYSADFSFLKLPIPDYIVKKGGGIRVKAIVNVDNFIPENENLKDVSTDIVLDKPQITGSEYIYKTSLQGNQFENYSSGVASNEPDLGREENALLKRISILDDEDHSNIEANVTTQFGLTKNIKPEEFNDEDMILGESILSSPNISYSKIYVKPIDFNNNLGYKSKSLIVKEFYTTKDIPFDINVNIYNNQVFEGSNDYNSISKKSEIKAVGVSKISKKDNVDWYSNLMNMQPLPFKVTGDNYSFTQNYQFILTNMNGKPKHTSTYSYINLNDENTWNLGTQTKYEYFDIAEPVAVINKKEDFLLATKANDYKYDWLGMRSVINVENRSVSTTNSSGSLDFDLGISLIGVPTSYSIAPSLNMKSETFNYFVTNKIIELYPQVKKITNIKDGIITEVENLAFDGKTGKPVLQKTTSNYSGVTVENNSKNEFYSYEILGHQEYKDIGNISDNEGIIFRSNVTSDESFLPILRYSLKGENLDDTDNNNDSYYLRMNINLDDYSSYIYSGYNFCNIKNLLSNGDEITLIIKSTSSNYKDINNQIKLNFIIENIDCYNIKLKNYNSWDPFYYKSYYNSVSSEELKSVDLIVTKSNKQNNLSTNISKINFFNPQLSTANKLPINMFKHEEFNSSQNNYYKSNVNWQLRQEIVNNLNSAIDDILNNNFGLFNNDNSNPAFNFKNYTTNRLINSQLEPLITFPTNVNKINNYESIYPIVMGYNYEITNIGHHNDAFINEHLGNVTQSYSDGNSNYLISKPLHEIKLNGEIYRPKYFKLGIKIDNRYNQFLSTSDRNVNQNFGGVVYYCQTCTPQFLKPNFFLNNNGEITYQNYYVDPKDYLLKIKKINILNSSIIFEDDLTYQEISNLYNSFTSNNYNTNSRLFDSITNFNNGYGKKVEWLNALNYSLNLEVLDFSKKLQKNLISTNSLGNSSNFISSNVSTFKSINLDSTDFNFNDIVHNQHVPLTNYIDVTDIKNNNRILSRLNDFDNALLKSKFQNYLTMNKQFNYYTNLNVFNTELGSDQFNALDYNNIINSRFSFSGTSFINEGVTKDTFRIYNWVDGNQNSNYNEEFSILKNNYNFMASTSKNKENVLTSIAYDDYLNILPNHLSQNLPSDLSFYQNFENYNLQFGKNNYQTNFGNYYSNQMSLVNEAFTGNYALKLKIKKSNSSNLDIKEYFHFLPNIIENRFINYNSFLLDNKKVIVEAWVKYDIENKHTIDFEQSTMKYDDIINKITKDVKLQFNVHTQNRNDFSLSDINLKITEVNYTTNPQRIINQDFEIIQQVGEWFLVRTEVENFVPNQSTYNDNDIFRFSISTFNSDILNNENSNIKPYIVIDDIRFFYQDANITSYVYDFDKMRISAILDNNHIPLKYVYNSNSEMNRIKLSTITGEKTVKESYLNVKKTLMNELHYKSNSEFNNTNNPSSMLINQNSDNEELQNTQNDFNSNIKNQILNTEKLNVDEGTNNEDLKNIQNNYNTNLKEQKFNSEKLNIDQNIKNESKDKSQVIKKHFSRSELLKKNLLNPVLNNEPTKVIESPKINESIKIDLFKKDSLINDK